MLEHYGLTEHNMKKEKCPEDTLKNVAAKLTCWRLDPLNLGSETVKEIENDCNTEELKKRTYLMRWSRKFGFKATYEELARKLLAVGNTALAEEVCKGCRRAVGE